MRRRTELPFAVRLWLPVLLLVGLLIAVVALVRTSGTESAAPGGPVPTRTPSPTATPAGWSGVALFLGDSYTAGVGASSGAARWTSLVAEEKGWRELNVGRNGTGYLAEPPAEACRWSRCPPFLDMVQRVAEEDPDVVVIAGGQNDTVLAHTYPEFERRAISATFAAARASAPDALIVAVGPKPIWGTTEALLAIDAEVQAAARAVCGIYVSLIEPPVLEPQFFLEDQFHVGDEGHRAIARRVLDTLAAAESAPQECGAPDTKPLSPPTAS